MIAVDTNLLVHHLMQDDPVQLPIAGKFLKHADGIFCLISILLEPKLVLGAACKLPTETVQQIGK
jgi:predicted nucleic-acid-binding protein